MTETNTTEPTASTTTTTPETDNAKLLENLKLEASSLGITFTAAATVKSLSEKIAAYREDALSAAAFIEEEAKASLNIGAANVDPKVALKKKALRLHRVQIVCQDKKIADRGCIFLTVANSIVSIGKVIPFDVPTHVPEIILNHMKEKKFISFRKKKVNGVEIAEPRELPMFVIQTLPPLTEAEFKQIAQRQQATKNVA